MTSFFFKTVSVISSYTRSPVSLGWIFLVGARGIVINLMKLLIDLQGLNIPASEGVQPRGLGRLLFSAKHQPLSVPLP